ncbi:MAG: class I SAM-dependent methyltransferase, partial [Proteobacteria bacterium]|nr:class I SAM-dependent methyltransferase [Pseudomonadota bacterium]
FKAHSEFKLLFEKFTAHNQLNNAGDTARLWSFILNIKQVMSENIAGDFAELGVWRGNTASILAHYAKGHGRKVFLFDTFEGFDAKDLGGIDADKTKEFQDTSLNLAKSVIAPNDGVCEFIKGYFPDSVTDSCKGSTFSIVSLDCDLYEPTKAGLEFFYPRMQTGGIFLLHDYSSLWWTGSKKAIDDFCKNNKEFIVLMPD